MQITFSSTILVLFLFVTLVSAQTTTFSYQGSLKDTGTLANGSFQMQFKLFDSLAGSGQIGSTISDVPVTVNQGIFTVKLDFGSNALSGADRWLEIAIRRNSGESYTTLSPREQIASSPYAVRTLSAASADNATTSANALNLGGVAANQYVQTTDPRLTDAREPTAGSGNYIQNQNASAQTTANFNISGLGSANIFDAATQFNLAGSRILSNAGTNNLFAGIGAGTNNTTGIDGAFFGRNAGADNTTGWLNSFFGASAGRHNTTGNNNAFFGSNAGFDTSTGGQNSFFGNGAGASNSTGSGNSFFGRDAGYFNTSGGGNVFVGLGAGQGNTTGGNNTLLGWAANVGANNLNFATAIGAGAIVNTNDTLVLGRNLDTVQIPGNLNVTGTFSGNGGGITNLNASNITSGTLDNARLGVIPISNGGTGSATQNFVDLTTSQTVNGTKTFTSPIAADGSQLTNIDGANITNNSINASALAPDAFPNQRNLQLLGSLRWDLLGQRVAVGTAPRGVAFDGANIWTANGVTNNVTKLRGSDGTLQGTFAVGTTPVAVAFDGTNVWVANLGSNNVTKLRAANGCGRVFPVGTNPGAVAFDGANIWVANLGSNSLTQLRASDGAFLASFTVGQSHQGIAFDGANIWVSNANSNNVTKLRASNGAILGTFAVGINPVGVAFDGSNIWVANFGSQNVMKLRATDGACAGVVGPPGPACTFAVGTLPLGVAFDGANVWVGNFGGGNVTKLRAGDGAPLGTFAVGTQPHGVAFDGANIWVANFGSSNVIKLPVFP